MYQACFLEIQNAIATCSVQFLGLLSFSSLVFTYYYITKEIEITEEQTILTDITKFVNSVDKCRPEDKNIAYLETNILANKLRMFAYSKLIENN